MKQLTIAAALAVVLGLSMGAQSMAVAPAPSQQSTPKTSAHHPVKVSHPQGHPAKPSTVHPAKPTMVHPVVKRTTVRMSSVRTSTQSSTSVHRATMPTHPTQTHVTTRQTTVRRVVRQTSTWRVASQPLPEFAGRTRVEARTVAMSDDRVIVSMPNGTLRTLVAFREAGTDRDRLVFRDRDDTRAFRVVKVSTPVAHRVVLFARREAVERNPEVVVLHAVAPVQNEIVAVTPDNSLMPLALTSIEPLPFGQMAFVANDMVTPSFVPADITFVGQPVSIIGDLVTFLLPDGTTRTLVDTGLLPTIGTEVAVVENGQQVVNIEPAVTTFTGQVVAAQSPFVTFVMPNGTIRTLTTVQPVPAPGTQAIVVENGDRVTRMEVR